MNNGFHHRQFISWYEEKEANGMGFGAYDARRIDLLQKFLESPQDNIDEIIMDKVVIR